jgi:hypothetical protein
MLELCLLKTNNVTDIVSKRVVRRSGSFNPLLVSLLPEVERVDEEGGR